MLTAAPDVQPVGRVDVVLEAASGTRVVIARAYSRGSWVWVTQYVIRVAVFLPLYQAGRVTELGIARVALSWPLVAACLAVSWWVIRRNLPPGHPGLRHPQDQDPAPGVRVEAPPAA